MRANDVAVSGTACGSTSMSTLLRSGRMAALHKLINAHTTMYTTIGNDDPNCAYKYAAMIGAGPPAVTDAR